MNIQPPETWPTTVEEAIQIQSQLKSLFQTTDQLVTVKYVAGVDV